MYVMKSKTLISCVIIAQLICGFVFAYTKSRFSHDAAQIISSVLRCSKPPLDPQMQYYNVFASQILPCVSVLHHSMSLMKPSSDPGTDLSFLHTKLSIPHL